MRKKQERNRGNCGNCGQPFKAARADAKFCSDRCAAAWARNAGYHREDIHASKEEWINKNCEECGTIFRYNEYALRGGERVPKFCSNKCRQANYRARKAAQGKPAGFTGNWNDARNDKTDTSAPGEEPKKRSRKGTSQEERWYTPDETAKMKDEEEKVRNEQRAKHHKGTSQPPLDSRWKSKDAYEVLGVTYLTPIEQVKKAWKKLLRTYHPDVSKDPNAAAICKKINWAWDRVENPNTRANRR